VLAAEVAGLYNIKARGGHRRRRYGSAMTRAAMDLARTQGYMTAALETSGMGEGGYRALGFRRCREIPVLMLAE
jgi:ribosomal protein S18 acetylase RimI-like enzyme